MGKKKQAIKTAEAADLSISKKMGEVRDRGWVRAAGAVGELGDQPPLIAFCAMVAVAGAIRRDPAMMRAGGRMLAAHLGATAAKALIKRSVDRTRPHMFVEDGHYESGPGERDEGPYNSFPSGHTAGAVAVARALACEFPETAPYAYAAAGAIAAVQVPKCAHFVSDILAGAVIGWSAGAAASSADDHRERQGFPSYS